MICAGLTREQSNTLYRDVLASEDKVALKQLCTEDLFFFLTVGCKRKDIDKDWLYDRCREVETSPDGHLDLWAREHYKSTIITFGLSIQNVLKDPDNTTVGIFSHTRPTAKAFLKQIKTELEKNKFLHELFPDVLYSEPDKQSKKWSEDQGLRVKRKSNPKEETFEAWGLVDGQPTSKHFSLLVYDDVVTLESVTTPDQIKKVTAAWEMSLNLGAQGGKKRYIGTRYHLNDTYRTMMDRGSVHPRLKPATKTGKWPGESVFMPQELLEEKRRDFGPYTFGTQMLQDPVADKAMGFKTEWLKYYKTLGDTSKWNRYLIVDPASKKKPTSDYTVMVVIGLAPDANYYFLDGIRDRLNLTQRAAKLFELHRKWMPKAVGYEEYGKDSDIEHIQYEMEQQNYRFSITALGGAVAKEDRIKKLVPVHEQGRFWYPETHHFVDYEGKALDYIKLYKDNEYAAFPVTVHDDMLDCKARILDPTLGAVFPKLVTPPKKPPPSSGFGQSTGWMGN